MEVGGHGQPQSAAATGHEDMPVFEGIFLEHDCEFLVGVME
jgi:hypothetical protein